MKKRVILLFIIILFSIIISILANAQIPGSGSDTINPNTGVPKSVENIEKVGNKITPSDLQKGIDDTITPIKNFITNIMSIFNFLWQLAFDLDFSWSLLFLYSFIIFLILFFVIFIPVDCFFSNKLISIFASIIIVLIIGISGVIEKAAKTIETAINAWWLALIAILLALLIMILYAGGVRELIKKIKEESKKEKQKRDEKQIEVAAENAKKQNESYGDGGGI